MTPKEEALELINKFLSKVYCYIGSGMLSNDYDESVANENAKECALIAVNKILEIFPNTVSTFEIHYKKVKEELLKM